jgi:hypothetical protein
MHPLHDADGFYTVGTKHTSPPSLLSNLAFPFPYPTMPIRNEMVC